MTLLSFETSFIAFAIILVLWLYRKGTAQVQSGLSLPTLKFEDNDTTERYISDTKSLLHQGYVKVF